MSGRPSFKLRKRRCAECGHRYAEWRMFRDVDIAGKDVHFCFPSCMENSLWESRVMPREAEGKWTMTTGLTDEPEISG